MKGYRNFALGLLLLFLGFGLAAMDVGLNGGSNLPGVATVIGATAPGVIGIVFGRGYNKKHAGGDA
jgi:hypothetical protein